MTYNQGGYPPQQPQYPTAPQGAPKAGGYLYPNEKKQRAEQPDQKGKIKVGEDIIAAIMSGQREFYISGWNKQDQKGQRFLSVNLKVIEAKLQGGYGGQHQTQWAPQPPPPQYPHATGSGWASAPPAPVHGHHAAATPAMYPTPQTPQYGAPPPQTPPGYPPNAAGRNVAPPQGGPQGGWDGGGDSIPF